MYLCWCKTETLPLSLSACAKGFQSCNQTLILNDRPTKPSAWYRRRVIPTIFANRKSLVSKHINGGLENVKSDITTEPRASEQQGKCQLRYNSILNFVNYSRRKQPKAKRVKQSTRAHRSSWILLLTRSITSSCNLLIVISSGWLFKLKRTNLIFTSFRLR